MTGDCLGIDIGSVYTKIIELDSSRNLISAKKIPMLYAAGSSSEKQKIDFDKFLKLILDCYPLRKLQEAKIALSLYSGNSTYTLVTLPRMSKKEMSFSALIEAKRKMILPPGPEAVFESLLLEEKKVDKAYKTEVLVIKTEKQSVDERLDVFKKVGIFPKLITTSSFAVINSIPQEEIAQDNVAIVNIGANTLDITIAQKSKQRFFRSVNFGCRNIILDISEGLNIAETEAENNLIDQGIFLGLVSLEGSKPPSLADPRIEKLKQVIQLDLERIVNECRRSFIFYKEESGERIEKILFTGGGILAKDLFPYLAKNIGGESKILEPFKNINLDTHKGSLDLGKITQEASLYASACGLAQVLCDKRKLNEAVNFLPLELKKREGKLLRFIIITEVGLILILGLIWGWLGIKEKVPLIESLVTGTKSEYEALQHFIPEQKKVSERKQKLQEQLSSVEQIKNQSPNIVLILKEIGKLIPEGVTLTELSMSKAGTAQQSLGSQGSAAGGSSQAGSESSSGGGSGARGSWEIQLKGETSIPYEQFSQFIGNLAKKFELSSYFKEVQLTAPKTKLVVKLTGENNVEFVTPSQVLSFTLKAKLK
jgi:type IV pilus assembly protein PilM